MSLISSKMILANNAVALGGEGSAYTAYQSHVFASAGNFTLPAGDWWVVPNADCTVDISTDGGTTWVALNAVSQGCFIRSDGVNARINSTGATTVNFFGPA